MLSKLSKKNNICKKLCKFTEPTKTNNACISIIQQFFSATSLMKVEDSINKPLPNTIKLLQSMTLGYIQKDKLPLRP